MMNKALFLIGFVLLLAGCSAERTGEVIGNSGNVDDVVRIPLSEVTSTLVKHYFDADGVIVTYLVVRGSDGEVRTAFDACDVCGGRGYFQRGSDVVCKKCGRSFRIDDLGTKNRGGGCWPSYLSHRIEDGSVLIDKAELASGAFMFR